MSRSQRVVLILAALLLFGGVAATFAPSGRFEDSCGPWVASDPANAIADHERLVQKAYDDLIADNPNVAIAVAGLPEEAIRQVCSTEHQRRAAITGLLTLLGVLALVWLGWTRRRDRSPAA